MPPSFYEPLTALDSWFLYGESANTPLHIGGVYIFEAGTRVEGGKGALGLARTLEERMHLLPRYRQKVKWLPFNLGHPVWVDDPDFDMSYHVRHAALPKPGDDATLREYAARVYARPLDLTKPPWEVTIVEGLEGDRVAMISKVHHSMVDGISTVDIGALLLDAQPEPTPYPQPDPWEARPAPTELEILRDTFLRVGPITQLRQIADSASQGARELVSQPWDGAMSLARTLLRPSRPLFFNRPIGPHRRLHSITVPLALFKQLKDHFECTVNDVVLAVIAEALQAWLRRRGEDVPDTLRVFCPVSVRDESARYRFGNMVSGMVVELPTAQMSLENRLHRIVSVTGDLKRSKQAVAAQALVQLADFAPATLHTLAVRLLPSDRPQWAVNMIVTNVPGPQQPFYTGGALLVDVWPFVPVYHSLGLNIALTSYNGNIHIGLQADRDLVPDLADLAESISEAAEDYRALLEQPPATKPSPKAGASRAAGTRRGSRPARRGSPAPRRRSGRTARRPSS
ncbi:MAG TPA: wax ester/triacylglycerol synthase family O-acyltransferase [Candidatus Dormibacteraeota bacterium]